jgi:threonine/homoserine/homoserine lactone efflux protein
MLENYPQVFFGLKILGAGYILWIAWRLGKSGAKEAKSEARTSTFTFTDGVFLFLLNPKAYVSMSLAFSLFIDSFGLGYGASVLLITAIYTGNNVIAFLLWALVGEQIAARFERPETAQKLNIIFSVTLVAVAIWILIS